MKVLGADLIILGTRKLWWMFPIKQKLNITAAFFHTIHVIKMFKTRQFFWSSIVQFPCPPGLLISLLHIGKKMSKFGKIEHFGLSQKATVVSNFCLSGGFWLPQAQSKVVKKKISDFSYWAWSTPWGHVLTLKTFCRNLVLSWAISYSVFRKVKFT